MSYAVPDRAPDDHARIMDARRRQAEMREDGMEPCDECGDWFYVDGNARHEPMRKVADGCGGRKRYLCQPCFSEMFEKVRES